MFGRARDVSLFRHVNRELINNIITQQVGYYKYMGEDTKDNIYGESGDDSLSGNEMRDWLYGGTGNDTLLGGDGDDDVEANAWGSAVEVWLSVFPELSDLIF